MADLSGIPHFSWTRHLADIVAREQPPSPTAFTQLIPYVNSSECTELTLCTIRQASQRIFQKFGQRLARRTREDLDQVIQISSCKIRGLPYFLEQLTLLQENDPAFSPVCFIQFKLCIDTIELLSESEYTIAQEIYRKSYPVYMEFKDVLPIFAKEAFFRGLNDLFRLTTCSKHTPIWEGIEQNIFGLTRESCILAEELPNQNVRVELLAGEVFKTANMDLSHATDAQQRELYEHLSRVYCANATFIPLENQADILSFLRELYCHILHISGSPQSSQRIPQRELEKYIIPSKDCPNLVALQKRNFEVWNAFLSTLKNVPPHRKSTPVFSPEHLCMAMATDIYPIASDFSFGLANAETLSLLFFNFTELLQQIPQRKKRMGFNSLSQQIAKHLDVITQGQCLKKELEKRSPGETPATRLRSIELALLKLDLWSHTAQSVLTILTLNMLVLKVTQSLLEKGALWEPHPDQSDVITLCPPAGESKLHLQMEEALCDGYLDIACRIFTPEKDEAAEATHWQLFAIRHYLEEFITKECKQYYKLVKEYRELIERNKSQRNEDLCSSVFEECQSIIKILEMHKESTGYADIRTRCPSIEDAQRCIGRLQPQCFDLLRDFCERARQINEAEAGHLSGYESQAACLKKHIDAMTGYARFAPMSPLLAVFDSLHFADPLFLMQPFETEIFPRFLDGLMTAGEKGLATAVSHVITPGNEHFRALFLDEMGFVESADTESTDDEASPEVGDEHDIADDEPKIDLPQIVVQQTRKKRKKKSRHPHQPAKIDDTPPSPVSPLDSELRLQSPVEAPAPQSPVEKSSPIHAPMPQIDRALTTPPKMPAVKKQEQVSPLLDIQKILSQSKGQLHDRVLLENVRSRTSEKVREACFKDPQRALDFFLHHTYPFEITKLVRTAGQEGVWISSKHHQKKNRRFVCLGEFHAYGSGKPPELGYFSETYYQGKDRVERLYHHCFHAQPSDRLLSTFEEQHTLFARDLDLDEAEVATQSPPTPYEIDTYERLRSGEQLFEDTSSADSFSIQHGRRVLEIRKKNRTIELLDKVFGCTYKLLITRP